jgi:hypothetical protein
MSTLCTKRSKHLFPAGKSQLGEVEATTGESLDGGVTPPSEAASAAGPPDTTSASGTALNARSAENGGELARAIEFLVLMGASSFGTTTARELRRSGRRQIVELERARRSAIRADARRRRFGPTNPATRKRRTVVKTAAQRGRDRSASGGVIPLVDRVSSARSSLGLLVTRSPL